MVLLLNLKNLVNIKYKKRKEGTMTSRPCDTCTKDCVGGIIYGNCQQFLTWRREINPVGVYVDTILYTICSNQLTVSSE